MDDSIPEEPKLCSVCGEPACAYIPTHWPMVANYMHPRMWVWRPSLSEITRLLDNHHKEYKYKRFCRTHGLAFIDEYNKAEG